MKQQRYLWLACLVGLLFPGQVLAEKRVVVDVITGFGVPQVIVAVKADMQRLGCQIQAETTHPWGKEVKCTFGEENVTVQAGSSPASSAVLTWDYKPC